MHRRSVVADNGPCAYAIASVGPSAICRVRRVAGQKLGARNRWPSSAPARAHLPRTDARESPFRLSYGPDYISTRHLQHHVQRNGTCRGRDVAIATRARARRAGVAGCSGRAVRDDPCTCTDSSASLGSGR
ncbi:unnamed protein product, partial [Iphiclides podalirius]